jgi:hypothetical protein
MNTPSVSVREVFNAINEWKFNNRGQRLGQYLMNKLLPNEQNSDIFYETDNQKAVQKFLTTYQ